MRRPNRGGGRVIGNIVDMRVRSYAWREVVGVLKGVGGTSPRTRKRAPAASVIEWALGMPKQVILILEDAPPGDHECAEAPRNGMGSPRITNIVDNRRDPAKVERLWGVVEPTAADNEAPWADEAPDDASFCYERKGPAQMQAILAWAGSHGGHVTLYLYDHPVGGEAVTASTHLARLDSTADN